MPLDTVDSKRLSYNTTLNVPPYINVSVIEQNEVNSGRINSGRINSVNTQNDTSKQENLRPDQLDVILEETRNQNSISLNDKEKGSTAAITIRDIDS